MVSEQRLGRTAGALYVVTIITGLFSLGYVPAQLSGHGDIHVTLARMAAAPGLFRWGLASFVIEQVAFLLLPLVLFQLLRAAGQRAAVVMVVLAVTGVPLALIALAHRLDLLPLIDAQAGGNPLPQADQLAQQALDAYTHALLMASLFWGLWLMPLGYLAHASRALPRILGFLLTLGGASYVADVFCTLLAPHYGDTALSDYMTTPAAIGEIGTGLWLLLVGVRRPVRQAAVA
ncbi:DUF4386 domain-containing protein [Dyella sp.]|uniref:DUF4386 domain-containing protein n=1 Tax=Dyella sp. TaxID=1869338 RepID=UPI002ED42002